MTIPDSFTVVRFNIDGDMIDSSQVDSAELDSETIAFFAEKFEHLSGDMELPLESDLPGDTQFMEFRIGSDIHGAYVLYYFHDEVIFTSIILNGTNEESESELMQIFKFLLLESGDSEDPTEEEIDAVLESSSFDFEAISERPVVIEISTSNRADEVKQCELAMKMNRNLAGAFFAIERETA